MKSNVLLRVAAIITALFAAGHAMGGLSHWSPPGTTPVLAAMQEFRFDVFGAKRSYFDFYIGFGHYITVLLLTRALLLWQLGAIARRDALAARPMILAFALSSLAAAGVAWVYLFIVPAAFAAALTVCLTLAFVGARFQA